MDHTEKPSSSERQIQQHQKALEKIVRTDHVVENETIYRQIESKEIILNEAKLRHERLLIKVASVDHMTGLDNSRAAEMKLAELIEYCAENDIPIIGIFCDGNDFREINNKIGHDVGDEVIKALAEAIKEATRTSDLPVRLADEQTVLEDLPTDEEFETRARIGGDEFFVALPGANLQDASTIFSRISTKFASITDRVVPQCKQRFGRSLTVTGGAAQYDPAIDESPHAFIKRCERTMQTSKDTQKGSLIISNPKPLPQTTAPLSRLQPKQ